jgi:hypothetical protein
MNPLKSELLISDKQKFNLYSYETQYSSAIKIAGLMLFREIIAVVC